MCGRAELVKFTADDPMIAAMEALLAPEKGETYASRVLLHFALGKAYLDLGNSPAALSVLHFQRGQPHEAYGGVHYNADATERYVAAVAAAFTPELLGESRRPGGADHRSRSSSSACPARARR